MLKLDSIALFGVLTTTGILVSQAPPEGTLPEVTLNILDHPMQPIKMQLTTLEPGKYAGSGSFWMGGRWEALIRLPDGTLRVRLRAR